MRVLLADPDIAFVLALQPLIGTVSGNPCEALKRPRFAYAVLLRPFYWSSRTHTMDHLTVN